MAIHIPQPLGERSLRIIELSKRPDGVTAAEAQLEMGGGKNWATSACSDLAGRGHIVRARAPGTWNHYFATQEAADRWLERNGGTPKARQRDNIVPAFPKVWHLPARDLTRPGGPKHTFLPAPEIDVRYQVDPSERVVGGFATAGIGRYIE